MLPHGAKGFQTDDLAVTFGDSKIVLSVKPQTADGSTGAASEKHYTFHTGPSSGVVDVHETLSFSDGHKERHTLFALRADELASVLQLLTPMLPELVGLFRPLRIGWMKHNNIGVARGLEPVSDADVERVTTKRKRKLAVDPQRYRENIFIPEYLEEIYDFPDGNFTLLHRTRNIGIGFKQTDSDGRVRLYWIKRRDLMRFGDGWHERVLDALRDAAIPPERYAEYPFLRR